MEFSLSNWFTRSSTVAGRDIVNLLNELQTLNLEAGFLSDPAFKQLVDYRQSIFPEPVGRNNPFSPVGSDGAYQGTPVSLPTDNPEDGEESEVQDE